MDQLQRELKSLEDGRLRFLRRQERVQEDQGAGAREAQLKLTKDLVIVLASWIEYELKSLRSTKANKKPSSLVYLEAIDPLVLARLTLHVLWNQVGACNHITNTLALLGKEVETEVWAKALEDYDSALFKRLVTRTTKVHGSLKYRKKALKATAAKQGFKPEPWSADLRVTVAGPLLNAALKGLSAVFELSTHQVGRKTTKRVSITPEASRSLQDIEEYLSWMKPVFTPMVTPPRPWEAYDTGCYHTPELAARVPLVRSRDKGRKAITKRAIADGVMDPCLEALNAIQATPWAINKPLLEVVSWCWENGKVISKFPRADHIPLPERPDNYEDLPETAQKGWRLKRSEIIERNRGIDSERITVLQDLRTAQELAGYPCFWIPHSLDFRGRVYPVCHFNQQRADYVKSLMHFAVGKPLGEHGAYWLAVHLANCGDFEKVSKRSLDDRVQWVEDNIGLIEDIANDPKATFELWSEADKPFQFLAACIDFKGYLDHGGDHVSHIAVALDGSNSGLQHYSAALRSQEGSLVNLTPSDRPSDIYQAVADLVEAQVKADADKGDALALKCLQNGIGRSLVKRNVMTFAYSSGQFGFKQQLLEDLMAPLAIEVLSGQREEHPYAMVNQQGVSDGGFFAAGYLSKKTWEAVNTIVQQASEGMRFFQQCAQALAHEAKPLLWYSPVGLPVLHRYDEWDVKRVKLFLHDKDVTLASNKDDKVNDDGSVDKLVRLEVRTKPKGTIDKRKARNAVAPNVIHSLDAAHLMLTVLDAKDVGITNYSLIHDSFGTHAADTPMFFDLIRNAFVNMYETYDPFETIRRETLEALDDKSKAPSVPAKGTLDLHGVLDSLYAFA